MAELFKGLRCHFISLRDKSNHTNSDDPNLSLGDACHSFVNKGLHCFLIKYLNYVMIFSKKKFITPNYIS